MQQLTWIITSASLIGLVVQQIMTFKSATSLKGETKGSLYYNLRVGVVALLMAASACHLLTARFEGLNLISKGIVCIAVVSLYFQSRADNSHRRKKNKHVVLIGLAILLLLLSVPLLPLMGRR